MKFLALFRKEFREALPWLIVAAAIMLLLGGMILQSDISRAARSSRSWRAPQDDQWRNFYAFRRTSHLTSVGTLLFLTSAALGLALGVRQFCMPGFTRTWAFTLHRSVGRRTVLFAKVTAACAAMAVSVGAVWTLLFLYASRPGVFPYPPKTRILVEGWVYILLGLLAYLGVSLCGLSRARWYTTKLFPLAFAVLMGFVVMFQASLCGIFVTLAVAALVLGVQLVHLFVNREY